MIIYKIETLKILNYIFIKHCFKKQKVEDY
jgi:hypothetical protein